MTDDKIAGILKSLDFTVIDRTPRSKQESATIEQSKSEIIITGSTWGANSCMTATLDEVSYDNAQSTLTITIETVKREGAEICSQSFIQIDYELLIELSDANPDTIVVIHRTRDGEKIAARSPAN